MLLDRLKWPQTNLLKCVFACVWVCVCVCSSFAVWITKPTAVIAKQCHVASFALFRVPKAPRVRVHVKCMEKWERFSFCLFSEWRRAHFIFDVDYKWSFLASSSCESSHSNRGDGTVTRNWWQLTGQAHPCRWRTSVKSVRVIYGCFRALMRNNESTVNACSANLNDIPNSKLVRMKSICCLFIHYYWSAVAAESREICLNFCSTGKSCPLPNYTFHETCGTACKCRWQTALFILLDYVIFYVYFVFNTLPRNVELDRQHKQS